ncbi:GntR family transcriptional regulator [Streptomyces sp. CB02923]|nr:GntR family transcriptional regulator [Streptomyces sp. CB02923]
MIRQRIEDGSYAPGTRVPSVVEILGEFGISTSTGQKVHRGLRAEGLIYTEPGIGSFVSKRRPAKCTEVPVARSAGAEKDT